jgi:hypothetical protein
MANELGLRKVSFEVDDLRGLVDRLAAAGYRWLLPGRRHRPARAVLADGLHPGPEGILVSLAQRVG